MVVMEIEDNNKIEEIDDLTITEVTDITPVLLSDDKSVPAFSDLLKSKIEENRFFIPDLNDV